MPSDTDISSYDAAALADQFRAGALSPTEVLSDVMSRARAANGALNAFVMLDHEGSAQAASASEKRWREGKPLSAIDGVPVTIKDLLQCQDWPTTYGSHVLAADPAKADAPAVARLKEAGAVLIGMTTSPELGWKGVTDSARHGITRNPWDATKTSGGSSGGAAVAAALNLGCLHIGTDGGGSIRMPAGFTGTFGIKPSFGRVPAFPASAFGTVAHVGPMTRTVRDAAAMLNILSRPDSRDWHAGPPMPDCSLPPPTGDRPLAGKRIAYSPDLGYMKVSADVAASVRQAVHVLQDLGAEIDEIAPPFANPQRIFECHWFSAAAYRFAQLSPEDRAQLDPGLREAIASKEAKSLREFQQFAEERVALGSIMTEFMGKWDALVTPTLPFTAFDAGQETPDGTGRWTDWAGFNFPFNLTQQPSASIPCGFGSCGLPVGLQITTARYQDTLALQIAAGFEAAQPPRFPDMPSG